MGVYCVFTVAIGFTFNIPCSTNSSALSGSVLVGDVCANTLYINSPESTSKVVPSVTENLLYRSVYADTSEAMKFVVLFVWRCVMLNK